MHVVNEQQLEVMDREEAERFLRLAPGTLSKWATQATGPRYSRSGDQRGKCLYQRRDLLAWLETRAVTPGVERR